MKLRYEKIDKQNVKIAALVQYKIFPDSCAYFKYLNDIGKNDELPINYLVYYKKNPIGVVGLYTIDEYQDTIWLSWFGILKEYRYRGYGKQIFKDTIEKAKKYNKKFLRLFTYEVWNSEAQVFYQKHMQISEYYTNESDNQYDIIEGKCKIFGYSLCDEKIGYWNNLFIDIGADDNVHDKSILLMKKDNII